MVVAPRWTGREAAALRQARRMSIRAFAGHLGVAAASIRNWESRAEHVRLRTDTQQILDTDLQRASDDVRERFEVILAAEAHTAVEEPTPVGEQPIVMTDFAARTPPDGQGQPPGHAAVPDHASLPGFAEISRVFASQAPIAGVIRHRAQHATELDVLAVRGLGILGLNDSLIRPALAARTEPARLRVLLLDPDCPAAVRRAGEIGEAPESFRAGIRLALARLDEIAESSQAVALTVALYQQLPVWRIIRLDEVLYVSAFATGWEGHESTMYEISQTPAGALSAGFRRLFEDAWDHAQIVTGGAQS